MSLKRFFVTKCCTCCGPKYSKQDLSSTKSKIPPKNDIPTVKVNNIITTKPAEKEEKNGYRNKAFITEDDSAPRKGDDCSPGKQLLKGGREDFGKPRQSRQISDLSEVFRLPCDDKSLSELVFEELDKSKTLQSSGSFDALDDDDVIGGDVTRPKASERDSCSLSTASDSGDSYVLEQDTVESANYDVTGVSRGDENDVADKGEKNDNRRSSEWRDKLQRDLLNDDEVDFIDDTTDDDLDENQPESKTKSPARLRESVHSNVSKTSAFKALHERPLIVDNGSYSIRAGWSGKYKPSARARNVVGHWRAEASEAWQEALGTTFVGETAIQRHATLSLNYPVEDGQIVNWRSQKEVWDHLFSGLLEADLSHQPILISESASVDKKQREKMVEVLIETLRFPGVCSKQQSVLSSLSTDREVGLVVHSGHGTTEVMSVYNGYPVHTSQLGIGGRHITDYLASVAQREKGVNFKTVAEYEVINDIKENHAFVRNSSTYKWRPPSGSNQNEITLPDGRSIDLDKELTYCAEPLFDTNLIGKTEDNLPQLIKKVIESTDPDVFSESDNTILLAGGNGMLKGLKTRLQNELNSLLGENKFQIRQTTNGTDAAWIGASILSEQTNFANICVSEDMYFEHGASAVHRYCF